MKSPKESTREGGANIEVQTATAGRKATWERHALADFYKVPEGCLSCAETGPREPREIGGVPLPLELSARLDFLRLEKYCQQYRSDAENPLATDVLRRLYYLARPLLPNGVRRAFQRLYLSDWRKLAFPCWPVDTTVESELEAGLVDLMRHSNLPEVPFIWFWPNGAAGAVIMTHDVETREGLDFVPSLMDIDDQYGFKGAYQLVPQKRYSVSMDLLEEIKRRGCEANVHGLDHNANLFDDFSSYLGKAEQINQYIKAFSAEGFRSPCMYRNVEWLQHLNIQYDMSVPNVAHLEPQRGGCCTVFPYFIGSILELPLTTIQDYSLLHILKDYSIVLWKEQVELILSRNGLVSFIAHPDYLVDEPALRVYRQLLEWLRECRTTRDLWVAKPGEVNRWWRLRARMALERKNGMWEVIGEGAECANVAIASSVDGGRIQFRITGKR